MRPSKAAEAALLSGERITQPDMSDIFCGVRRATQDIEELSTGIGWEGLAVNL